MTPAHASPNASSSSKRPRVNSNENEELSMRRRIRVSEACTTCRIRKDRCDGGRPKCNNCLRARRDCTYKPTKKRGLRTGYVRALETLLGLLFSTVQGLDPWVAALFEGQETVPSFHLNQLEGQPAGASVEALIDTWRRSALLTQVEHALSTENNNDGENTESGKGFDQKALQASVLAANIFHIHDTAPQEIPNVSLQTAMESQPAARMILTEELATQSRSPTCITEPIVELEPIFQMPCDQSPLSGGSNTAFHADLEDSNPMSVNWRFLLDIYFYTTHCWLPMCQKHELLRTAFVTTSASTNQTAEAPVSPGERTFLTAILSYATFLNDPEHTRTTASETSTIVERAVASRDSIKILFPNDLESYEIGHVRALLILTLIDIACGNQDQAWISIGSAIFHVTVLVKPYLRQERPTKDLDEGIRRTLLCCMSLDCLVAAWIGLRPYFTRSDIVSIGPLLTDGLEEWEPWRCHEPSIVVASNFQSPSRSLSIFNEVVDLVSVLNDMLRASDGVLTRSCSQTSHETTSDWLQRIPSTSVPVEAPLNPQQFNCYLLANSIQELIRARVGRDRCDQAAQNTYNHLSLIDDISKEFIKVTGKINVSPTCRISLFLLRLATSSSSQPATGFETELQSLRDWLQSLQSSRTTGLLVPHTWPSLRDQYQSTANERYTEPHNQRIEHLDSLEIGSDVRDDELNPQRAVDYLDPGYTHLDPIGATNRGPSTNSSTVSPLIGMPTTEPDGMGLTLSDDGLFQSLASLDSADWLANFPDFMMHLGAPNTSASSMDRFLDVNPD
ncbi:hypothetical protein FB567DRAFT_76034 [Paraphoma chrysanthemicola]|uniref:Zn(2)-C6 fungal-type domain-containing protein n=1 Tax=Paraphoma chrysanthemicola TaxID=798071 RepID=A0A8K0VWT5_9PLEO|nr:hypothetical protein FB567DRAFT_76034 [Paraphoma chrysanthemicola]